MNYVVVDSNPVAVTYAKLTYWTLHLVLTSTYSYSNLYHVIYKVFHDENSRNQI